MYKVKIGLIEYNVDLKNNDILNKYMNIVWMI